MYNLVMAATRLNSFLLKCLEHILRPMGDHQIRLLQNWLIALSNALFALRSKGRKESLLTSEEEAYNHLQSLDKNIDIYASGHIGSDPLKVHINVPLLHKPFPSMETESTTFYRFPFCAKEKSDFAIKHIGATSDHRPEAQSTSSGISIVNFFANNAYKKD